MNNRGVQQRVKAVVRQVSPALYSWIHRQRDVIWINVSPSGRAWRANARKFYRSFLTEGDLCFDVGANRGKRTELLRSVGTDVIAIEPQKLLADHLSHHFRRDPQVRVVRLAVSPIRGEVSLRGSSEADTVATLSPDWTTGRFADLSWDTTETVPTATLEDLIRQFGRPRFIKLDVEGYEREVLSTLQQPVEWICFEFAAEFIENVGACLDLLEELAEGIQASFVEGEAMRLEERWTDPTSLFRILKQRAMDDSSLWGDVYVRSEVSA